MSGQKPIRVAVFGAAGRMGREILALLQKEKTLRLCAVLDDRSYWDYHDVYTRLEELKNHKPQVIIDFSSPEGTMRIVEWCEAHKVPLVTGTTGLSAKQQEKLMRLSKKVSVLSSPNMSLAINILAEALGDIAAGFTEADVEIEEIHHKHKKDRPSGTALFLKNAIEQASGRRLKPPLSFRGGEIFGVHKIYFFGQNEWIGIEHHATNRAVFAQGALAAARWIVDQKRGLYSMKNLIRSARGL